MFQIARFLAVSAIAIGVPMIAHAQDERLSILSAEMFKLVEKKQDLIKIDRWTSEHAQTYQRVSLDLEALSREIERLKTSKSYPITKTANTVNTAGPQLAKVAFPSTPSKSTTASTSAIWEDK